MTETEIQKEIIEYLKTIGAIVFRMNSGRAKNNVKLCPPGTPDLMAVLKTGIIWIEVKTETGTLRDTQVKMHKKLTDLNQNVIIARRLDDVVKIIVD